ncbi:MAG: dTDP-4-dehydrorhamnose 3,5-epimerase family protein [Actinobacteria bacterium]|nr:dTDP-4-dehydrorhamnose 3,5-epimerase family protein [Actinomycetota bacterium]
MIDGVKVKQLKVIPDERGYLMEMLRCDDDIYEKFGQTYITACYPGVIKGWHYHKVQVDHFTCIIGMVKVVLYDDRNESPTRGEINEFFIGEKNNVLLKIPKGVLHGFKAIGYEVAIIVNVPTEPYNREAPDEYRIPFDSKDIPYDWDIKMG